MREGLIGTCLCVAWPTGSEHPCRQVVFLVGKTAQEVLTDIRCTAWLLWRIHLAFRQMTFRTGMGAHFALVLTKMLPLDMVQRLAASSQAAFDCLVAAFPAVGPTTPGLEQ